MAGVSDGSAAIRCYGRAGWLPEALRLWEQMPTDGVVPTGFTFNSILDGIETSSASFFFLSTKCSCCNMSKLVNRSTLFMSRNRSLRKSRGSEGLL